METMFLQLGIRIMEVAIFGPGTVNVVLLNCPTERENGSDFELINTRFSLCSSF